MSHQVLARKWRPKSFSELVGQEHVVRALSNALDQGRLHHAYLFTGTRGVGKTTLARILAKCLNCEAGVGPTPCGVCPACQQIETGRFVDLIEIDAASYTGVDNMREVLENAQYAPTAGRYKVYIIDEVHMLSKNAFNAMLKTLEEPPAHVLFILATTDPQKVPVTVLSRCLQFNLRQMPAAQVGAHLARVLEQEGVPFEAPALDLLGRAAAGSMRDALSLTDQAIAYGGGRIEAAATRAMLGSVDQADLFPLLDALHDGDGATLMQQAEAIVGAGLACDGVLQDLARLLQQIALAQTVPAALGDDVAERDRLLDLAGRLDPETVQLYYQIANLGRHDLDWAPDEAAGLGMTLIRMLAFSPGPAMTQAAAPASRPTPRPVASPAPETATKAAARPAPRPEPTAAAPSPAATFDGDWLAFTARLPGGGMKQLAAQCELVGHDADSVRLRLPDDKKSLVDSLGDKLRAAVRERLGDRIRLEFEFGATQGAAPVEVAARAQAVRQSQAEADIYGDPFVQAMMRDCDATVSHITPIGETEK